MYRLLSYFCGQVVGPGHGDDALLHAERYTQGPVQKYSQDPQVFPDFCFNGGKPTLPFHVK